MSLNPDVVAAFFAGAASLLTGTYAVRRARREERENCELRISEIKEMYDKGIEKGLHMSERYE